ncbi:hypothetical protein ACA910_013022 [Epithemia clementina (nom. ined.)]
MHPLETVSATASRESFSDETELRLRQETDEDEKDMNCCSWYWRHCVWPGLGLFGESYLLFSIGTMLPIWEILFDECFNEDCSSSLLAALHYSVVLGVIPGMLTIGYASKFTGRRTGSLVTAFLMASGAAGLTMTSLFLTENQETLVRSMVFFWFVFGFGVGGEYPMAASQASENAASRGIDKTHINENVQQQHEQQHEQQSKQGSSEHNVSNLSLEGRDGVMLTGDGVQGPNRNGGPSTPSPPIQSRGKQVQFVFSMQGLGILLNSVTMTALLVITANYIDRLEEENAQMSAYNKNQRAIGEENGDDHNNNNNNNNKDGNKYYSYGKYKLYDISSETANSLLAIWRLTYFFGMLVLGYVWYSRYYYLKESKIWLKNQRDQQQLLDQEPPLENMGIPVTPQPSQIIYKTFFTPTATLSQDASTKPMSLTEEENMKWKNSGLDVPSTSSAAAAAAANGGQNNPPIPQSSPSGMEAVKSNPPTDDAAAAAAKVSALRNSSSGHSQLSSKRKDLPQKPGEQSTKNQHQAQQTTKIGTMEGLGAVSIVPTLSNVSTISSLSAPSVMAHTSNDDENYYYHFMPDGGEAACGTVAKWSMLYQQYGVRLFGVSVCWLLWDIAFYGNKLFQSTFLLAMIGGRGNNGSNNGDDEDSLHSLMNFSICATLNAAVAFLGYIVAAFLVDIPAIGRRRLQQWGLVATGILFVVCGFLLDRMSSSSSSWLVVSLYFGTSFFGQVGPNCTTFLIPAEIFPTEIRTVCHGIAAASGKLGALFAAIIFNYTQSDLDMFLLSGYASLVAGAVTFWTIPESLGLPLEELDQKWKSMIENKPYHGPANQAKYLSVYERNQIAASSKAGDVATSTPTMDYRPEVEVY